MQIALTDAILDSILNILHKNQDKTPSFML